jgi:hypothetical protein
MTRTSAWRAASQGIGKCSVPTWDRGRRARARERATGTARAAPDKTEHPPSQAKADGGTPPVRPGREKSKPTEAPPTWIPGSRARKVKASDSEKPNFHLSSAERQSEVPTLQYVGTVATQRVTVLVDTGCNGIFVSSSLVRKADLVTYQKPSAHTVRLANGTVVKSHTVARVPMRVQGVWETLTAHVLDLADHDIILGIPWQSQHDVLIRPLDGTVRFKFKRAKQAQQIVWVPDEHSEVNKQLNGTLLISALQLGKVWKKQARLKPHERNTQFHLCVIKEVEDDKDLQSEEPPDPGWQEKVHSRGQVPRCRAYLK